MRGAWRYRLMRGLGRLVTRTAATLTLGHMPPFVSTSAVVCRAGEILMVVDPIRNEPILPGGHLTWRETPLQAVQREVREETGIIIQPGSLLGVYAGMEWSGEEGIVRIVYGAEVAGGALVSSAEGEAVWIDVETVARSETRDAPIVRQWLRAGANR